MQFRYVHGPGQDEPLIWYEGSGTSNPRFLHADQQGSIIAVTSSSGSVLNINTYDAFGNRHSSNENYASRFAYTGQVWLKELGLYYYKARMYNAKLGRFMQTDPIGYQDGMNWYGYVHGDPVNGRDPTGLADTNCDNDPGVCTPPVDLHVYGKRNNGTWCEGWDCQDLLNNHLFGAQEGHVGAQHLTEQGARRGMSLDVSQAETNLAQATQLVDEYFINNPGAMPEGLVGGLTFQYNHEIHPTAGAVQRMFHNPRTGLTMANGPVQMYAGSVNDLRGAVMTVLHEYGHHSSAALAGRRGNVYQTNRSERAADNYARRIANEIF